MQRGSGKARGGGKGVWESFGGGAGWDGGGGGLVGCKESERGGEVERIYSQLWQRWCELDLMSKHILIQRSISLYFVSGLWRSDYKKRNIYRQRNYTVQLMWSQWSLNLWLGHLPFGFYVLGQKTGWVLSDELPSVLVNSKSTSSYFLRISISFIVHCCWIVCLLMTHSPCKFIIIFHTDVWDSERIHAHVCFLPVCVEWWGHGRRSQVQDASPLSPLHHTSHWQAISLLDSEFRPRDHLKHFGLSSLGENVTPSPLNTTFQLLPTGCRAKSVRRGKLWRIIFFIFSLFFLKKIWKFSNRGWFSTTALVAWPLLIGKEEGSDLNGRHQSF